MTTAIELLDAHVPSISDQDEMDMDQILRDLPTSDGVIDYADFARRTCSCGKRLADVYDYHDHLKAMFEKEST